MKFILFILSFILWTNVYSQKWLDNTCPIEKNITKTDYISTKANNLLTLVIDQEGKLVVNGDQKKNIAEIEFKEMVYEFLINPERDKSKASSPKDAIIAISSYGEYPEYDLILTYIREVYLYAWDLSAKEKYSSTYAELECRKRTKIRQNNFPYRVFEMDKESPKKNNTYPVPSFDGDVIDN